MNNVKNIDGLTFLSKIKSGTIDLVLTDPPYIISHETGMNTHYKNINKNMMSIQKTEEEWNSYKKNNNIQNDNKKHYI
jgi:DNA modification methylase